MAEAAEERLERIQKGVERWLVKRWPQASGLELRTAGTPKAGLSNETLLYDVSWVEAGKHHTKSLVLRLAPTGEAPQVFPEYDLSLQHGVMERLAGTGVPVPTLLGFEEDPSVLGSSFFLMERIEGRCPVENPPYHAQGWLVEASAQERASIWDSGLRILETLAALDWRAKGFDFLDRPDRGQTPVEQQLHYYREYFSWAMEGRAFPLAEEALEWLEAHRPSGEPVALCWGDPKLANMLFDGTRCVAALDWEMAHLGNPVDDLAWYMILDRGFSEGCNIPRLEGFPSREATVARWEELTGHRAEHLGYYEVFGALRLALIIYRVISNLKRSGLFPADSTFDINNNAAVVLENEMAKRR